MVVFASSGSSGLHAVDWGILVLYALSTLGLGWYFGRQQNNTKEYFVGSATMNPVLIGVSLFATLLSAISYLGLPGEGAGKGPVWMCGSLLALPLAYFVVALWLIPVYMKQRVTSAYELLESRLGLSIRLLGATMFLVLRLVWMTLLVYAAAKAMTVMTGLDAKWIPRIVLITGLVAVVYTSLGGLRAVVVTDCMQTILLFGGALMVIATVTYHFGGFGWFPTEWHANWKPQPIFSFDPRTRVTVMGTILTVFAWTVATMGGDQTSVQRFMATRDASAARRAVKVQFTVTAVVEVTLFLVGAALLGYFMADDGRLPSGMNVKDNADDLFPLFIGNHLPIGISGLVVAGIFAAAMSSMDSGVNSITAVVLKDYLERLGFKPTSPTSELWISRLLALGIGTFVVYCSSMMRYVEGNILDVTKTTVDLLTSPIFALFFFALFVRRANPLGVWVGAICGTLTAAAIAFSGPLVYLLYRSFDIEPSAFGVELITQTDLTSGETWTTAEDPISWQWIGPTALVVNMAVGTVASVLFSRRRALESGGNPRNL